MIYGRLFISFGSRLAPSRTFCPNVWSEKEIIDPIVLLQFVINFSTRIGKLVHVIKIYFGIELVSVNLVDWEEKFDKLAFNKSFSKKSYISPKYP